MKRIVLSVLTLSLVALSACKKEYQCKCETVIEQQMYDENGDPMGDPQTTESTSTQTIKEKESTAREECEEKSGTAKQTSSYQGMSTEQTITTSCELK